RNMVLAVTAAAAIVSAGAFSNAKSADLYPEAPPPVAEIPPPAAAPPMAVVPRPPAVVLVEPPCPVVWRCGYWGCGWRHACGPVGYISARGEGPPLSFVEAMLAGLARDGGLYVPEFWPVFAPERIAALAGLPYAELALEILRPFVDDAIPEGDLARMTREAYGAFRHPAVAPLVQLGPRTFVLELFHGPTLAFKDLAMQLLARLMDHVLRQRGERATVICATS